MVAVGRNINWHHDEDVYCIAIISIYDRCLNVNSTRFLVEANMRITSAGMRNCFREKQRKFQQRLLSNNSADCQDIIMKSYIRLYEDLCSFYNTYRLRKEIIGKLTNILHK